MDLSVRLHMVTFASQAALTAIHALLTAQGLGRLQHHAMLPAAMALGLQQSSLL
jgi:hypothetical protein